jgi:uncharacterized protein (DUF433 family)
MRTEAARIDVDGGFYTIAEAARLLGMGSGRRITRWLQTTPSGRSPVVIRDYPKIGREHEISFLDLIEIKFVEHFRAANISMQALRTAAQNARERLGVSHPFATGSVKFQSDRKKVFLQTARETGDRELLDLMTKQVVMYEIIERTFAEDLEFDASGFARVWRPAANVAPNVIVSPAFAFGRPVISRRRVPTRTLFESWRAHNGKMEDVADWFDINVPDVDEAVRFELRQAS